MKTTIHPIGFNSTEPTFSAIEAPDPTVFQQYDTAYWTYTSNLSDERLPLFINALTKHQPVSFKGKVFFIRRILMCEEKTIIVLKVIKVESQNKSSDV